MSTADLLRHVKKLSPRERQKFLESVLAMESKSPSRARKNKSRKTKWPDIEARARKIFGDQVLPNMVRYDREGRPF
jgi:hypothetical protein